MPWDVTPALPAGPPNLHAGLGLSFTAQRIHELRNETSRMVQRQQGVRRRWQQPHLLQVHVSKRHFPVSSPNGASQCTPWRTRRLSRPPLRVVAPPGRVCEVFVFLPIIVYGLLFCREDKVGLAPYPPFVRVLTPRSKFGSAAGGIQSHFLPAPASAQDHCVFDPELAARTAGQAGAWG